MECPNDRCGEIAARTEKKTKLRIKMDMMREFMRARLFEHRPREGNTTGDTDQEKKQLLQLKLQTSI